jgi:hypothetical protein
VRAALTLSLKTAWAFWPPFAAGILRAPHVVGMVERVLERWERAKTINMAERRLHANTQRLG